MHDQFFGFMDPKRPVEINVTLFGEFRKLAEKCFLDEDICDLHKWLRNFSVVIDLSNLEVCK